MGIILRENEWAANMIRSRTLGKKPSETLRRVARFYIDAGCGRDDARDRLRSFLLQCCPHCALPKWDAALDYAVGRAYKYEAINIECIDITRGEMNRIDALDGKQIKRLAFTLLCLAKYWQAVMPDSGWWVNSRDSEIMAMANINTSIKRQSAMFWTLREAGMIQFSKRVDNTNVRVCFAGDGDGEPVLSVTDFRNLGYQYLYHHGEAFYKCSCCGLTVKANEAARGRKQKYCGACATEIKIKQNVNSVMKQRNGA